MWNGKNIFSHLILRQEVIRDFFYCPAIHKKGSRRRSRRQSTNSVVIPMTGSVVSTVAIDISYSNSFFKYKSAH